MRRLQLFPSARIPEAICVFAGTVHELQECVVLVLDDYHIMSGHGRCQGNGHTIAEGYQSHLNQGGQCIVYSPNWRGGGCARWARMESCRQAFLLEGCGAAAECTS